MKKLTIILAHPDYSNSIANKTIVDRLIKKYPDTTIRNIGELYPDFKIDVEAEQKNLVNADVILFQFPVNWYNVPAILKQWFDKVLTHGFAYGGDGDKLTGKTVMISATAGGDIDAYTPIGKNHFRLRQFYNNIEATAYLCGMNFGRPVFGYNNIYIPGVVNTPEIVQDRAKEQAENVIKHLEKLLQ